MPFPSSVRCPFGAKSRTWHSLHPAPHAFYQRLNSYLSESSSDASLSDQYEGYDSMDRDSNGDIGIAVSRAALYEDQTLCTQLLKTITTAIPLQILPSKIPGAGAGLFVTRDLDDGEEIFRSDPLVNCVENGMQSRVCDSCYDYKGSNIHPSGRFWKAEDIELDMKACGGCKVCYYCSKVRTTPILLSAFHVALRIVKFSTNYSQTCQRKAWKRYHKYECAMFSQDPDMYPRTRALYRLLNMHKHDLLSSEQWAALNGLQPHVGEHVSSANAQAVVGASEHARSRTGTELGFSEVLTLHCTVRTYVEMKDQHLHEHRQLLTNALCIHPAEGGTLGTSLDIVASLMNHSCEPNALIVFQGNSLRVRSIRKLVARDEITQCYTDVDMDVLIRRHMLKSDFFFDCHCS